MLPGGKSLAALNELKRRVKVNRDERTYVVEVDVTSRDPNKAVSIANAIAQAYLAEQTQVRADAARQVSQSLTSRLKELKDSVREAEDKVEAYKQRNNLLAASGQLVTDQQLTDMDNQLSAAHARTADAKARLEQVEAVQHSKDENGAFPAALQSPTITALRGQYAEVMRREAEQTASLGALHPAVIDIQAQAERLRRMIDAEIDRAAVAARTEYESAKSSEQMLAANFAALKADRNGQQRGHGRLARARARRPGKPRHLSGLFGARARDRRAGTGRHQEYPRAVQGRSAAEAQLAAAESPGGARRDDARRRRRNRHRPGAAVRRDPPQAARHGALRAAPCARRRRRLGWRPRAATGVPVLAVLPAADVSFALETVDDPASPFGKEMRKVYDEVRASHASHGNPSVLVLAADDADDTAMVALTLAAVAAATQRVLVIDADLRRRTLAALDAEDSDAGLVDVAVGRRGLSDAVTVDRDTNINLIAFVAPGSRRDRRIYDADIKRAFELTRRYDLVIVAAADHADPSLRFFAGLVDHIVLVAGADGFDETRAERFIARAGLDAGKVRGAVLTGFTTA